MSMKVGLGACQEDLEVQGEIDFDFFERDENNCNINGENAWKDDGDVEKSNVPPNEENSHVPTTSDGSSCPEDSGACCKEIRIDIPSPENYNNGQFSPVYGSKKRNLELAAFSPHAKYGEDPLGSPLSSSSASDFSSSSYSFSDGDSADEDTDSMTDVSPLPSNCVSPMVARKGEDLAPDPLDVEENPASKKCQKVESGRFSGNGYSRQHLHKTVKVNELMKAIKQLEIEETEKKPKSTNSIPLATNSKHKKNPSFSNEEVRRIDHDNQRLLKRIVAQQNRTKPTFTPFHTRPSSSSVNRQRQQRQIELDNIALLQRLESAKPSRDLSRSHLLNEYKRRPSVFSSKSSSRPVSSASMAVHASCRNMANASGRSSTLTVPLCRKAKQQ